jgi:hypothetical protein
LWLRRPIKIAPTKAIFVPCTRKNRFEKDQRAEKGGKIRTQDAFRHEQQLFVAGWSKAGKPDAFTVLTAPYGGIPAWEVVQIRDVCLTPCHPPVPCEVWLTF